MYRFSRIYSAKMLAIVLTVIVLSLTRAVDSENNMTQCPNGCNCHLIYDDSHLTVDCVGYSLPVEQLSRDMNLFLSDNHIIERLAYLSITNTPLTRVPTSVCQLLNLQSLYLDHNRLIELPDNCFTQLKKLVMLSLTRNSIVGLQDGLFDGLQNMVTLDLSLNYIASIGLRLFSNASDLTSLRSLDLSGNRLTSLEPWWYHRCFQGSESSPVKILLSWNRISNFTNEIQFHFRCEMKRPHCYIDLYNNNIIHIMDILSGWNISFSEGLCLMNVVAPDQVAQLRVNIARHAPYVCDCIDFPFYKLASIIPAFSVGLNGVLCDDYREVISISLMEFVCDLTNRCPSRCRCVYRPENSTLHVYCSSTNLSTLPLEVPPLPKSYVKYKLDFSNNKRLRHLEHRPYFVNTSFLDVSNCGLTEITMAVWKYVSRFTVANFQGNKLHSFPRPVSTMNISARLLLGSNPWTCSCDNSWMITWLQSLSGQISDPGDIICSSPARMYGRNVLKSTENDFCVDPVHNAQRNLTLAVSVASTIVAVLVVLVIVGLMIYKLRVKFYRRWKFHPFDRDECVGEDMDFDVFLCCSSEDHNPDGLRILELLESNGYRVCYHLRDFLAGSPIADNMIQSIQHSKRTVCLLSTNFLQRYRSNFTLFVIYNRYQDMFRHLLFSATGISML